jgi:uncharacterized protein YoaH (UPF0181 family)
MTTSKLHSIVAVAEFIRENKEELMKNIESYEHMLRTLKKATDEYEKHGMSIVDDPDQSEDEGDEADKWLNEQENKKTEESAKRVYSKDWSPRADYSPQEAESVKKLMADGYSHREAERLAGAHRGPRDYRSALTSGVNPSMPSDKMMGQLKGLAKEWLDAARSHDLAHADEMKNPMKHASGQMEQAHKEHVGDYHQAYSDFLASDAVKSLSPRDRHKAVQEWKTKWKQENPDYEEGLSNVSQVQSKFADAAKNIEQRNKETTEHIARGGVSEVPDMTEQEAVQHLGGKTEEGLAGGSIVKDPAAAFAAKNPRYVKLLNQDQMDRVKRVDSASALQGKVRIRKKPQEPQG